MPLIFCFVELNEQAKNAGRIGNVQGDKKEINQAINDTISNKKNGPCGLSKPSLETEKPVAGFG